MPRGSENLAGLLRERIALFDFMSRFCPAAKKLKSSALSFSLQKKLEASYYCGLLVYYESAYICC